MHHHTKTSLAAALVLGLSACAGVPSDSHGVTTELVRIEDVEFTKLNPARGDQSPQAGTLYGDRNGTAQTGFLFRPVDGFQSPPHIHNVTYRGVVISGWVHNDDPAAEWMWMPARSFWTQPRGGVHITSAKGTDTLAYIEIDEGPYLVKPTEERFETGERPVNVHESNLVWVHRPGTPDGVELAHLWKDRGELGRRGILVKIPAETSISLRGPGPLRGVVVEGEPGYTGTGRDEAVTLRPGSYFGSTGDARHRLVAGRDEVVVYVRARGEVSLTNR